jgi:hypothetical protein
MDANLILQAVTLSVTGWVLLEVISMKVKFSAMSQKIKDLPCSSCGKKHTEFNYD